jgi:hypothetical protein
VVITISASECDATERGCSKRQYDGCEQQEGQQLQQHLQEQQQPKYVQEYLQAGPDGSQEQQGRGSGHCSGQLADNLIPNDNQH